MLCALGVVCDGLYDMCCGVVCGIALCCVVLHVSVMCMLIYVLVCYCIIYSACAWVCYCVVS